MWRCPTSWHPSEEEEEEGERLLPVLSGVAVARPWELLGTRDRLCQAPLSPVRGLPCAPHQVHMLLSEGLGGGYTSSACCAATPPLNSERGCLDVSVCVPVGVSMRGYMCCARLFP